MKRSFIEVIGNLLFMLVYFNCIALRIVDYIGEVHKHLAAIEAALLIAPMLIFAVLFEKHLDKKFKDKKD